MTQKYQVKVSMKQAAIVETGIVLKQGDFGMQIEIEVLDFDATGITPQIVFRKAMGAVESTTITVSGNKYTYTFKGTELDTPGKVFCDLKLKNSTTQRISTASFMFKVVADTMDGLEQEASSYSDTIAQIVGGFDEEIANLDNSIKNIISETKTENLFNKNDVKTGYILEPSGTEYANSSYSVTNYIPLDENTTYTLTHGAKRVFYNSNKERISGMDYNESATFTTPANTAYMRFTVANSELDTFMLVEGSSVPTEYIPYAIYTLNSEIIIPQLEDYASESELSNLENHVEEIGSNLNSLGKYTYDRIEEEKSNINLFDKHDILKDTAINASGSVYPSEGYNVSAYIPVEAEENYIMTHKLNRVFYNSSKVRISGMDYHEAADFTTPANTAYIRICVGNAQLDTFMIVKGETLPEEYTPYATYTLDKDIVIPQIQGYATKGELEDLETYTKNRIKETKKANLFNKDDIKYGYILEPSGTEYANSSYSVANYIPLDENTTYTLTHGAKRVFYNSNKERISGMDYNESATFTTPANTAYMRFTVANSELDTFMLVEGSSVPTEYEPYATYTLDEDIIVPQLDEYVGPRYINLFDKTNIIEDMVLNKNGATYAQEGYNISAYIPVKPETQYLMSNKLNRVFYNSEKVYISGDDYKTDPLITTPANTAYIRICVGDEQLQTFMIVEGDTLPEQYIPYQQFKYIKDDVKMKAVDSLETYAYGFNLYREIRGLKYLFMGDSITQLGYGPTGWPKVFGEYSQPSVYKNTAVIGATMCDKDGTVYDGDPVYDGPDHNVNNVFGNQVQKVINNYDEEVEGFDTFDVIIISFGTNDNKTFTSSDFEAIEDQFTSDEYTVVPLAEADRKTFAGAMRYGYEKLRELYPTAKIIFCSPIESAKRTFACIKTTGEMIKDVCQRISDVSFIDTAKCGICSIFEIDGSNGRDLTDGLHPNANGAAKIGKYNFAKYLEIQLTLPIYR